MLRALDLIIIQQRGSPAIQVLCALYAVIRKQFVLLALVLLLLH